MQHFCNDSCGLCPTTTAAPTTPHPCTPNPCQNGGTCSIGTGNGNGSVFICTCRIGFSGDMCDRVDLCFYQPCKHGTCSLRPVQGFSCTCDPGFTGILCDTVVIQDCKAIKDYNISSTSHDDIYFISLYGGDVSLNVRCDTTTAGGGWTELMDRTDGRLHFPSMTMSDYADGFGSVRNEFWIGLEAMHKLTSDGRHYQLRVELVNATGKMLYQVYDDFAVGAHPYYTLHVGANRGTAGDSLSGHDGFGFSSVTPSIDRDANENSCAEYLHASWWFHSCADSCLTCKYDVPGTNNCRSMAWNSAGYCTALRKAKMMVRPM
ncbi:microfibril-associated glycoprotein 4-like [Mya arenaria]|uniref:microfibril-associated glycoprotein 4-like n=1 Tax=Mya arenaria TaxID=6604 RepID=UPI0022E3FC8E|nr:microfibril-associated glycoprotein 4-like [Mya arenaria]